MERHLNPYIEIPLLIRKAVLSISILHFPLAFEVSLEATGIYVCGYFVNSPGLVSGTGIMV